ncbi:MAG: DUF4234 domain-containing protein [Erysipelotrichaceae bacterium]
MIRIEKRNIVSLILLSLITCGVYSVFLYYKQTQEIDNLGGFQDSNPGIELLLILITCGIYGIFWQYKYAKRIAEIQATRGMRVNDVSIINIVLSLFGMQMIAQAIMQNEMNNIIDFGVEGGPIYR